MQGMGHHTVNVDVPTSIKDKTAYGMSQRNNQSFLCSASCLLKLALNILIASLVQNCWWVTESVEGY